jgi:hypothetical protein
MVVTGMGVAPNTTTGEQSALTGVLPTGTAAWTRSFNSSLLADVVDVSDDSSFVLLAQSTGLLSAVSTADGSDQWVLDTGLGGGQEGAGLTITGARLEGGARTGMAVVSSNTAAVGVRFSAPSSGAFAAPSVVWTLPALGDLSAVGRPTVLAQEGLMIFANTSQYLMYSLTSGKLLNTLQYPTPLHDLAAVAHACSTVSSFCFVSGMDAASGAAVFFSVNRHTGQMQSTMLNPSLYAPWGRQVVVDSTGTRIFANALGPRWPQPGEGGSPYLAVLTVHPTSGAFTSTNVTTIPQLLLSGVSTLALGPADGQITLWNGEGFAICQN